MEGSVRKRLLIALVSVLSVAAVVVSVSSCEHAFPDDRLDFYWRLDRIEYKDGVNLRGEACQSEDLDNTMIGFARHMVLIEDLSRNFGKETAMLAGFDYVTGDCMVIIDADLQHPPTLIPDMIKLWEQGYDAIYAKRKTRGKESWLRKRLSLQFYKILQSSSRFDVLQNVGDFRLLDRSCINALKKMRESERYTKGMYCWIGFKKKEIEFVQGDRVAGESSWNYRGLFSLTIDGITSFTNAPLRISAIVGFVVSMFAFLYMIYVFFKALIYGDPVQGYPTLVILILFLGGIQLLSLGIIGEYIGRIYNETKNRPDYIVRVFNDEKVL